MIESTRLLPGIGIAGQTSPASVKPENPILNFASELADVVRAGESAAVAGVTGTMPLQQVVESVMQAERAVTAAVSIRDKVVNAYLEMTRMQI